ncbi:MAG TPA: rhomboid family intramembrane serine protease [Bacteroidales bacterium]
MAGIIQELKDLYKNGGVLIRLIFINCVIFLIVNLIFLFSGQPLFYFMDYWFSLPSNPTDILSKPWTLITYMFYHREILHILFNMLNLYWFGKIFLMYFDEKKLVGLYFLGGIAGGIFYVLFANIFPSVFGSGILMGASAAIIAIMFAAAFYIPDFKLFMVFIGQVKLIYIAIFSLFLYVVMIASSKNAGGNLAHLGGAFIGYLWIKQYKQGIDLTKGVSWLFSLFKGLFTRKKLKVSHKRPPIDDLEYNRQKNVNQKEIDRILDKISKGGYESLSKSEKDTLFKMSNKPN